MNILVLYTGRRNPRVYYNVSQRYVSGGVYSFVDGDGIIHRLNRRSIDKIFTFEVTGFYYV